MNTGLDRGMRSSSLAALAMALLCSMSAQVAAQETTCPTFLPEVQVGTVASNAVLIEVSGIVASRQSPGVLWVHNDSGDSPYVYAINTAGDVLATYNLTGAVNKDWEDIAIGPGPVGGQDYLYIGDIGNNSLSRSKVHVYRVAEPFVDPGQAPVPAGVNPINLGGVDELPMDYPAERFDAAALLVDPLSGDIIVVKKQIVAGFSEIYLNPAFIVGT